MARALALGFLVGFPIALSPGPIFFLVLRRTLARGWRSGFVSGLGVATGDATYAALAAFGVAAVTNLLIGQRRWFGLAGGEGEIRAVEGKRRLATNYGSMVVLTLSNPSTILSFTAVFAGLGIHVARG